jgi:nitronate monooxygenase
LKEGQAQPRRKTMAYPKIIQGGMGVAISDWRLAQSVSKTGNLGVVSGTGIGIVFLARLMNGDEGGHVRRALGAFPLQDVAQKYVDKYYVEGGKEREKAYKRPQMWTMNPSQELLETTILGNFVEVWLAKQGHDNPVGINLLEKVQMPTMASLYGAMLAGVDYVIMGAGIPIQIPGLLDAYVTHQATSYRLDVMGADQDADVSLKFDPQAVFPTITEVVGELKRPLFLPIISSVVLAKALLKRSTGKVNGFVIEMPTAGGHNAPPRGKWEKNERGEPIYTEKDDIDLSKIEAMGLPFWLAGGYGNPEQLQAALEAGAQGIQVGTAFAYCDESGMMPSLKEAVLKQVLDEEADVLTSSVASPTGFPFKVVRVEGTLSEENVYDARPRICDIGYLRTTYMREDGKIGYRCASEPVDAYVKKGGKIEDTEGRSCLCNNLGATAGFGQVRKGGYEEPAIVTSGDDLPNIARFIRNGRVGYSAQDVIDVLMSKLSTA